MIIKKRSTPLYLPKLQALNRRLSPDHPKKGEVQAELARKTAGHKGEQSLDYHLSFLPDTDCLILHDLRIMGKHHHFQLDPLILTLTFFLIIDAKNYSGTLSFDPSFKKMTFS
ncbi:nuclease-related domain-containing protein [Peribacillus sp. NPDC096379]|uniref:nuclease-related domain-containing protein n=1 Tax=Peribacillus sp. NPDC096379 TaxID=3364393 RepID=UPI0038299D04